jgi:PAS domain S-box-containing protein
MKKPLLLVVDDETENLLLAEELVAKLLPECNVITTRDPQEALQIAADKDIDGAIIDVKMPMMDGIELCRRLKANEASAHVPVVLVTAFTNPTERKVLGMEAGADDFISKPIDNVEFVAKIRVMLRIKQVEDELRMANARLEQQVAERTRELQQSEERYKALFEQAGNHILVLEPNPGYAPLIIDANEAACLQYGYQRDELIGQSVSILDSELNKQQLADIERRVMSGETVFFESFHKCKDGSIIAVEITAKLVETAGRPPVILSIERDISQHKQVKEERARLAVAVEQSAEGILIIDTCGVIQYANPAIEHLTGYSQKDLIDHHPDIVFKNEMHGATFYDEIWEAVKSAGIWKGSINPNRKDGSTLCAEMTVSRVLDENENLVNLIAIVRDVSHERELENQLRQSQKMEAVGTLAGGIAHDFNNILYIISGYSELAKTEVPADSELYTMLNEIFKGARRASELVSQILKISKSKSKEYKPIMVQAATEEALGMLRNALPSTIGLRQNIKDCRPVVADATEIHQVVMNLCTNAYHAMREEGGTLSVELDEIQLNERQTSRYPDLQPGEYARIAVSDTGCGMDEKTVSRIFEPYFTTKNAGEGTGLGLATVHGIVRNCHGAIRVESQLEQGSCFQVMLPLYTDKVDFLSTRKIEKKAHGGKETILVIDDEIALVNLQREVLERLGYRVYTFIRGTDALMVFKDNPNEFDLVITDQTMPDITGAQVSRQILEIRPNIPIILCTGHSDLIDKEQAHAMGIGAYLNKPIVANKLAKAVRRLLENKKTIH